MRLEEERVGRMALLAAAAGVAALPNPGVWGLWFGCTVLCAGGVGTGSFAVAAACYLLRLGCLRAAVRVAALTAFLAYLSVVAGLLLEMAGPRQPASVSGPLGCLALAAALAGLEFVQEPLERRGWRRLLRARGWAAALAAVAGFLIAAAGELAAGNLLLAAGSHLHPLWHSSSLPLFLLLSAVAVGFALVIFLAEMGERAFGWPVQMELWERSARVAAVLLAIWLGLRFWDLAAPPALAAAFRLSGEGSREAWLFWLEVALLAGLVVTVLRPARSARPQALFSASIMAIGGFLASRLNVSITALEGAAPLRYFPSWTEGAATLALVALDVALFALAARYLPVFLPTESPSTTRG